uniref:Uncharacterized protein n=1 Tax=Clytia hemisphaerica TaxID=252671 RepID=A0A7M5XA45_9CNID|eukprot:TCONS_00033669-protein
MKPTNWNRFFFIINLIEGLEIVFLFDSGGKMKAGFKLLFVLYAILWSFTCEFDNKNLDMSRLQIAISLLAINSLEFFLPLFIFGEESICKGREKAACQDLSNFFFITSVFVLCCQCCRVLWYCVTEDPNKNLLPR